MALEDSRRRAAGWAVMLGLSVAIAMSAVASICAQETPKWLEELRRDFRDVRRARKNQPALYRGLVLRWHADDRLDAVIQELGESMNVAEAQPPLEYGLGFAYAVRGESADLAQSETHLRRAAQLDPKMVLAHFSLGGVLRRLERLDEALAAYFECVRLDETYFRAYYAMGELYRAQGRAADALKSYELAVERAECDWPHPHYGKGRVLAEQGDDVAAELVFERVLLLDDEFARAYFELGKIRAREGLEAEALEQYRRGASHASHGADVADELQGLGSIFAGQSKAAQAESLFRQALALRPDDAPLLFDLGDALWPQDKRDEAVIAYGAAIRIDASLATVFTGRVRDELFGAKAPQPEARDVLDKALAVDPSDDEAHVLYAQLETAEGGPSAAIGYYKAAATLKPDRTDVYFPLGDLYFAEGDHTQAEAAYRRAVELQPEQRGRFAVEGQEAHQAARHAVAADLFRKHLLINSDDASARYLLARSFESLGRSDRAIEEYERVRIQAPMTHDTLARLARLLYEERHDTGLAFDVLHEIVELEPENAAAHFTVGEFLRDAADSVGAIAAFETVVRLDQAHVDAHESLARLYEETDEDASIDSYRRVIELAPDRSTPMFRLGALLLKRGPLGIPLPDDEDEVILLYTRALEIEPRRALQHHTLARLLDARDRLEEALPHYAAAVDAKRDDAEWHYDYARCAHRLIEAVDEPGSTAQYLEVANMAYTSALELLPSADAYFHRGELRRTHKQIGAGIFLSTEIADDFRRALDLRPGHTDALYLLAMTYVYMDEPDHAVEEFTDLLRSRPKFQHANFELGAIAEERRDYEGAVRYYDRELAVNPRSVRAHYRLGFLYQNALGDPGTASDHLERAIELDPKHVDALIEHGRVLYDIDRVRVAADQFERAVKLDPKNLTANFNLAMMYQYLAKTSLAIERWRYLLTLDVPPQWAAEAREYLQTLEESR